MDPFKSINAVDEAACNYAYDGLSDNKASYLYTETAIAFKAGAEWALKHKNATAKEQSQAIPQMGDKPIGRYIQEILDYAEEQNQTIAMLAQQLADKKEIIRRLTC